jgi:2-polyprenyl-3-methyl-5-hydroxy-6-metoxy-1,4-benzoquinol methylase
MRSASMRRKLMEILAEPGTGAPLRLEVTRGSGDVVEEGALVSETKRYPIAGGIPRFVEPDNYAASFGQQWNAFREVQLDSANGASYSRRRFDAEVGWAEDELRGKWLLDAGCGAGRFAEVSAARGANLVALDLSSAVDAAAKTLARFPNADVVQGSILDPPFRRGAFDFCYCIGVIQHTPDPPRAIRTLAGAVRPGGKFAFTMYGRRWYTKLYAKYLVRPLTKRMRPATLLAAIETTMPFFFPLTDALFRAPLIGKLAGFTIPIANDPSMTELTREQRYRLAILDTFDMLAPQHDHPMTWQEMERELRAAGAARWEFRSRVPVVVSGVR